MIIHFIPCLGIHHVLKRIRNIRDRNGITHTFNLSRSKLGRVDTNNLTIHIQKRTATVTGIDSRICLDQVHALVDTAAVICRITRLDLA